MSEKTLPVGRPIVRGRNGSKTNLHCRVPEEMKEHWERHVDESDRYSTLTDLVIETLNEKTEYPE